MKQINYVTTVIQQMEPTGTDTLLITLVDPDGWELPPFEGGANLTLFLDNGMKRAYSLCNDPANRYHYQIAVKINPQGLGGSRYIHQNCRSGDIMRISLPRSIMRINHDCNKHILIAGGIGITPMLSMIYELEKRQGNYELHYFYRHNAPMLTQLYDAMLSGNLYLYPAENAPAGAARLSAVIPEYHQDICLYCCGPERMMQDYQHIAQQWPDSQKQQEHFSAVVTAGQYPPYTLELRQSGKHILVEPGQSPLQALLDADVPVDYTCEGGVCGACVVDWCDGQPVHHDKVLTDEERQHKVILCVAGCKSEKLVLDL